MTFLEFKQGVNKKIVQPVVMYHRRQRFKGRQPTIISVNCIGGVFTMILDGVLTLRQSICFSFRRTLLSLYRT